jgi:hypothetical protein
MKAQRGAQLWLYSVFNLGARRGWMVKATPRPLDPRTVQPVKTGYTDWALPACQLKGSSRIEVTAVQMKSLFAAVSLTEFSRNFNILEKKRIFDIGRLSTYSAVNSLHLGYKNQAVNVV